MAKKGLTTSLIDFESQLKAPDRDLLLESFDNRYRDQFDAYMFARKRFGVNESATDQELVALGQQLLSVERRRISEARDQASLGAIPTIALDVVTATVATSILPYFASIQPIEDQHGLVWYRNLYVNQDSGGYTDGEIIRNPLTLNKLGDGTLGLTNKKVTIETAITAGSTYTSNVSAPVVPNKVFVKCGDLGQGFDDGNGKILGFGFKGTIDYKTGAISIDVEDTPTADTVLEVITSVDIDRAPKLDAINSLYTSKEIWAEITTLRSDFGMMSNLSFEKRWGTSNSEEIAQDLTDEIVETLNVRCMNMIYDNQVGSTTWDRKPFSGVSYLEHKMTMIDSIANAESVIHLNTGKGVMNRIIAGRKAAAALSSMEDFERFSDSETSLSIFGTWKGVLVARATNVIPDDEMTIVSNPNGYFNAPVVYSPYIPLFVTDPVSDVNNPLRGSVAAAIWSGMTPINSALATGFKIKNIDILDDTSGG